MTIIQPNKNKNFLLKLSAIFSLPLLVGVVWLVIIYNQTVNVEHSLSQMEKRLQEIQTANAELKDKFFKLLDSKNLENLATARGLIKEKHPQYLEIPVTWEVASQY